MERGPGHKQSKPSHYREIVYAKVIELGFLGRLCHGRCDQGIRSVSHKCRRPMGPISPVRETDSVHWPAVRLVLWWNFRLKTDKAIDASLTQSEQVVSSRFGTRSRNSRLAVRILTEHQPAGHEPVTPRALLRLCALALDVVAVKAGLLPLLRAELVETPSVTQPTRPRTKSAYAHGDLLCLAFLLFIAVLLCLVEEVGNPLPLLVGGVRLHLEGAAGESVEGLALAHPERPGPPKRALTQSPPCLCSPREG
eukprot:scaffold56716_cov35-Tisochrysis_lutea.AAC.2